MSITPVKPEREESSPGQKLLEAVKLFEEATGISVTEYMWEPSYIKTLSDGVSVSLAIYTVYPHEKLYECAVYNDVFLLGIEKPGSRLCLFVTWNPKTGEIIGVRDLKLWIDDERLLIDYRARANDRAVCCMGCPNVLFQDLVNPGYRPARDNELKILNEGVLKGCPPEVDVRETITNVLALTKSPDSVLHVLAPAQCGRKNSPLINYSL